MNYNLNGITIRSENAAKPHTMPSNYLCNLLGDMDKSGCALDFGCGKLRYSEQLTSKFNKVTFIDSLKQLEREQIIRGQKTTIIEYVSKNYNDANVVPFEKIDSITNNYDFILCSNVLSAIPCKSTISKIISSIRSLLKESGEALIVNQYKSSYFKKYETGTKHLYGYIYTTSKSTFYYGLLNEEIVKKLCISHGLSVIKSWNKAGSSYVVVGR